MSLKFSCFVTGTDTDVGKTLVAASLLRLCVQQGWRSVGMKPVAAGCQQDVQGQWRNADVDALQAASTPALAAWGVRDEDRNPYCFHEPIAPHIAAARVGQRMELSVLTAAYARLAQQCEAVVVEGAGGWRVPLDHQHDLADLAVALRLPVVLVVGMRLGCLNHALLTQEAIHSRGLPLMGWVANCCHPQMSCFEENLDSLQARLPAPLLGVLPYLAAGYSPPDYAMRHLSLPQGAGHAYSGRSQ